VGGGLTESAVAKQGFVKAALSGIDSPIVKAAVAQVAGNIITQGVSVAVGLQPKFSWQSVAQTALSAPLSALAGDAVGSKIAGANKDWADIAGASWAKFGRDVASSLTTVGVRTAMGGKFESTQVLADVFGNALGNAIVAGAARPGASSDTLEEIVVTAKRIGNNPTDSIRSGSNVSPDALKQVDEIVVTAPPIYPGDDYGLDMWAVFETQGYRLNDTQRERVDRMGDAASANYAWRQQYGRNAPWATDRLARDYDALTHAASGTGGRLLAPGQAGGSPSRGERLAGTLLNGLSSANEATRISILSDFKQGVRAGLDDFADYTIAHGWPTAIGGTMYAVGTIGVESLPETGLEALTAIGGGPALNLLGKARWLGRVVDDFVPNSAVTSAAHPLQGMTPAQVVEQANALGLKTPRDSVILWSGSGKRGPEISQEFAARNGGVTLEMTPGGSWLNDMKLYGESSPFTSEQADWIWAKTSESLVGKASGQVRSVLGEVRPTSIYLNKELPGLQANPDVTGLESLYLWPAHVTKMVSP
jgi:hypothetical protein